MPIYLHSRKERFDLRIYPDFLDVLSVVKTALFQHHFLLLTKFFNRM